MIANALIEQVQNLLGAGLPHREIAKITGVSRSTVNHIAQGRRGILVDRMESPYQSHRAEHPPERCCGCGSLVYLPCRACALRALMSRIEAVMSREMVPIDNRRRPAQKDFRPRRRLQSLAG